MNRGSAARMDQTGNETMASMRPRFMNRGSGVGGRVRAERATRFNEAPIHESGKSAEDMVDNLRGEWLQ